MTTFGDVEDSFEAHGRPKTENVNDSLVTVDYGPAGEGRPSHVDDSMEAVAPSLQPLTSRTAPAPLPAGICSENDLSDFGTETDDSAARSSGKRRRKRKLRLFGRRRGGFASDDDGSFPRFGLSPSRRGRRGRNAADESTGDGTGTSPSPRSSPRRALGGMRSLLSPSRRSKGGGGGSEGIRASYQSYREKFPRGEAPSDSDDPDVSRDVSAATPVVSNARSVPPMPALQEQPLAPISEAAQATPAESSAGDSPRAEESAATTTTSPLSAVTDPPQDSPRNPLSDGNVVRDDDDTVSTLGSLVTRDTWESRRRRREASGRSRTSDGSTVTELSEIDRLRRENDRLREELESASQLGSKVSGRVSGAFARDVRDLRRENDGFRGDSALDGSFDAASREMRSTLEAMLAEDERRRERRRRDAGHGTGRERGRRRRERGGRSRRGAAGGGPLVQSVALQPASHLLINGVDFDDSSITTGGGGTLNGFAAGGGFRFDGALPDPPGDPDGGLLGRIASTARDAAARAGTAARERGYPVDACRSSRPLDCFSSCATRRDGGGGGGGRRRRGDGSPPSYWKEGGRTTDSLTSASTADQHSLVYQAGRRRGGGDAGVGRRGQAAAPGSSAAAAAGSHRGESGAATGLRVTVTDTTAIPDALLLA